MSNISEEELLKGFPYALSNTRSLTLLARVIAEKLNELYTDGNLIGLYFRIDQLNEALLDILAIDLNIEWYNRDSDLSTKRSIIKNSFFVHRKEGTAKSVERAIAGAYTDAHVSEWFEYGGTPFHFKIEVGLGEEFYTSEIYQLTQMYTSYAKNVRSILDGILFKSKRTAQLYVGCAIVQGSIITYRVDGINDGNT